MDNFTKDIFLGMPLIFMCFMAAAQPAGDDVEVNVVWSKKNVEGIVEVSGGTLSEIVATSGKGRVRDNGFRLAGTAPGLKLTLSDVNLSPGPEPTLVTIKDQEHPFTFFLRDVGSDYPIYIPGYGVAVLPGNDNRSYGEVEEQVLSRKNLMKTERIEKEAEASFDGVAAYTRDMSVPVWLGLGRDMRMFEITEEMQDAANMEEKMIKPMSSSTTFALTETEGHHLFYRYAVSRGVGAKNNIKRWLEDRVLPIYHSETRDDDVIYHTVSFASLESSELNGASVAGTDYLVSDVYSPWRIFTDEQRRRVDEKLAALPESEEIVLYSRTEIENTGSVPRYAWMKIPRPAVGACEFDHETGFYYFSKDRVFCVASLNGEPIQNPEMAILLMPGEKAVFDFRLPHNPVSHARAQKLIRQSFDEKFTECRSYWNGKLGEAARIEVPEKRIDEMIRAGLLHLQLNTFGSEPDGPLAARVGVYSPIGTESAPIIQFYASMGLNDIARRSLDYFIATQQENGQIMNYNGYTVETGAALWCMGEYFRYSRDTQWVRKIKPQLLKACEFLSNWRRESKREELRGRGYGMTGGRVADPADDFHQFMLNGYGYMGMNRVAEMLDALGAAEADGIKAEADGWRNDIRSSAFNAMAYSPAVPLGDGRWSPTMPPWAEAPGPRLLYQNREVFRSHGTFTVADAMLGPIYLVFCEVFDPREPVSRMILDYQGELMYQDNAAFSQPYYSKHNWYQALLGMVKPFLNTYYTTVSAHADRDTYTFWEHFYRLSPHKTHEEGNFLMETRWMLYMEEGDTLNIFPTIPRAWMESGKSIKLDGVRSYFGELNIKAVSRIDEGYIEAVVEFDPDRRPACINVRLPHPENKKAVRVTGGEYLPDRETVTVIPSGERVEIRVEF